MAIIGIMSAFVAGRFMQGDSDLAAQTEVIKTHLRYAQSRSMNTNSVWYIQFSSNSYALHKNGVAGSKLLPGADSLSIALANGTIINYGAADIVSFDGWGKPCIDANAQTAQTTDRTLTISKGSGTSTITITKNTGFIP